MIETDQWPITARSTMSEANTIPEFYRGRCIFMTGATGFMGKVLVHKLLTDCGDLDRLYLLVRAKKGVEPKQRLEEYVNHMVRYEQLYWSSHLLLTIPDLITRR